MLLSELAPGARFRVQGVTIGREVGKRLADMGFNNGVEGEVVRRLFLSGPMQVRILGYSLLLRKSEAAAVEVLLQTGQPSP
ncbi:MAG: FeoA family protein [Rectinemataceae bacterium]